MKMKRVSEILGRLIDLTLINTSNINDFSTGSTIRSIYEAISLELEQYYVLQKSNILWGIDEGVYEAFDFNRKDSRRAYGDLELVFHTVNNTDIYLPRGSQFSITQQGYDQTFETLTDYNLPAGSNKYTINVYCTQPGTIGNVPAGTIDISNANLNNLDYVINPRDFLTGQDKEPLHNVKRRFREFVNTRGRATARALEYAVREVPDITGVYVYETTGWVRIYAHDMNGNLSDRLKNDIILAIDDYRPSGIRVDVLPVERIAVDFNIEVVLRSRAYMTERLRTHMIFQLRAYLNSMETDQDLILSDIVQLLMNIEDKEVYDVFIRTPQGNIKVDSNQLIRAGEIHLSLNTLDNFPDGFSNDPVDLNGNPTTGPPID